MKEKQKLGCLMQYMSETSVFCEITCVLKEYLLFLNQFTLEPS